MPATKSTKDTFEYFEIEGSKIRKLTGPRNWHLWKEKITLSFQVQKLLDYINGKARRPNAPAMPIGMLPEPEADPFVEEGAAVPEDPWRERREQYETELRDYEKKLSDWEDKALKAR